MRNIVIFAATALFACSAHAQLLTGDGQAPVAPTPAPAEQKLFKAAPTTTASSPTSSDSPLEITADNALEWQRNEKLFIAKGNAIAKQGDTSISASTLTAHYTEKKGGGMDISEVDAQDNVVINAKNTKASGQTAKYNLAKGYAFMTGQNLQMVSPDQTVTAQEKFEYWVNEGKFSAVGRAKAIRGTNTLEANTLSATMKDNEKGQRVLDTLEANGNVVISSPAERVTGNYGIYRAASNKAEMTGGVKITRGPNVLTGERAEVDLTTNTSRIFGSATDTGRVKGIFYPNSKN